MISLSDTNDTNDAHVVMRTRDDVGRGVGDADTHIMVIPRRDDGSDVDVASTDVIDTVPMMLSSVSASTHAVTHAMNRQDVMRPCDERIVTVEDGTTRFVRSHRAPRGTSTYAIIATIGVVLLAVALTLMGVIVGATIARG